MVIAFSVAALGIALFAAMDAVMKGLSLAIGVYNALLWRGFVGVLISGANLAFHNPRWPPRNVLRIHLTRGAMGGVLAFLFFWGLMRVPLAQGTALAFIAPIVALFLAAILLGEHISRRTIIATVIAFAGVLTILSGQASSDANPEILLGSLAILVSALCYAWNIILMRQQSQVAEPAEAAFFQSLIMALVMSLGAPWFAVVPAAVYIPAILGAALLATSSLLLLSWAYARAEANYLATVEYTTFIWAAIFGYVIFHERVSLYTLVGAAIIVAGCILAVRRRPEPYAELEGIV